MEREGEGRRKKRERREENEWEYKRLKQEENNLQLCTSSDIDTPLSIFYFVTIITET